MAIKAGQILHLGNEAVVIDRIQNAGPGALNVPVEKIYELGNYESVATIRDVPDLSFNLESWDVSCEIEALVCGVPLDTTDVFDLNLAGPVDIRSPFKRGKQAGDPAMFAIDGSVALPFLTPESVSYRFGLRDNAAQTWTLRGDSIFYCPGGAYVDEAAGTNTPNQTVALAHDAGVYTDSSGKRRVLSVRVDDTRLTPGVDYTISPDGTGGGFEATTVTIVSAVPATSTIYVTYFSDTPLSYLQNVHEGTTVKPAAVKGKDIDVYLGGFDPANLLDDRLISVQSANIDWRVTLEKDEELGNAYAVSQDFDVPDVTGTINVKPRSVAELFDRIRQITGVTDTEEAVGPNNAVPLSLDVVIKDGANGGVPLKRFHVPDARFTLPGYSAAVQQKLAVDLPFTSDGGILKVYKGDAVDPVTP